MKILAVMVSVAVIFGLGWANVSPAEKVKIATAVKVDPSYFVLLMAGLEQGLWKDQGLEAEWVPSAGAPPLMAAVAAGSLQIGLAKAYTFLLMGSRGLPVVVTADLEVFYKWFMYVEFKTPFKEPQDLKGLRVGVIRFGSQEHAYVRALLRALGIPEKETKIVALGGIRERTAALRTGVVDIIPSPEQTLVGLEAANVVHRVIRLADYLQKIEESDPTLIFAVRELEEKNPELVRKVIKGALKAGDFVRANPGWAMNTIKKEMGVGEKVAELVYKILKYSSDGAIYPSRLEYMREFLTGYGLIPKEKTPLVGKLYVDKFVPIR